AAPAPRRPGPGRFVAGVVGAGVGASAPPGGGGAGAEHDPHGAVRGAQVPGELVQDHALVPAGGELGRDPFSEPEAVAGAGGPVGTAPAGHGVVHERQGAVQGARRRRGAPGGLLREAVLLLLLLPPRPATAAGGALARGRGGWGGGR